MVFQMLYTLVSNYRWLPVSYSSVGNLLHTQIHDDLWYSGRVAQVSTAKRISSLSLFSPPLQSLRSGLFLPAPWASPIPPHFLQRWVVRSNTWCLIKYELNKQDMIKIKWMIVPTYLKLKYNSKLSVFTCLLWQSYPYLRIFYTSQYFA